MPGSVIVSSARTPIGKLSGSLASLAATDLGGHTIAAALARAGISGDQVDRVVLGQVLSAGEGQMPARKASVNGGVSMTAPAMTVNKACLSGLEAVYLADSMIASGDVDIVVAGGMESMTKAPYLLKDARSGYRMGNNEIFDSLISDGLTCALDHVHMGASTERDTAALGTVTREMQDEFSAKSHERAANAAKDGRVDEIAPIEIPQRRGDPILVESDEGIRPGTSAESLAKLRAAFVDGGTVTAGNASQISDGATAMVLMSRSKADELGIEPLAELVSFGAVAGPTTSLLHQPSNAIRQALGRTDLALDALELYEINEAFAAVVLASMLDLGITDDVVNVNGGAIALGHPIGASGARILITLVDELRRRGGALGAASLCGAGGQGEAAIVRAL